MRSCGRGQRLPRSLETASPISARDASKSHAQRKNCLESRISRADEGRARKRAFGPAPDDTPNAPPKRLPTAIGCSHRGIERADGETARPARTIGSRADGKERPYGEG